MSFRSHELYAYTLVLCRQDLQSVLAAMIQRSFKSIGTSISKEIKNRQGDNDAEIAKTLQTMHKMIVNKNCCSSAPSPDVQATINEALKRDFLGEMIWLILGNATARELRKWISI